MVAVFKNCNYTEFYKKYPKSGGFKKISRIGFNKKMTEALMYVEGRAGGLAGSGHLILLRKKDGNWKEFAIKQLWVS